MATHGQCFNDACFMLVSSFQCRNDPYTKRQEMRTTLPDAGLKGCCLVQGGAAHGWPGCRERPKSRGPCFGHFFPHSTKMGFIATNDVFQVNWIV